MENLILITSLSRLSIAGVQLELSRSAGQVIFCFSQSIGNTLWLIAPMIIASALAAGIYLTLRDRNSAPLRALSQSVKNMARGDMRTPIWGMERQDTLGELARAVDMARFQFSQLPDMAVMSDQGPVRLRFEGTAALMRTGRTSDSRL